MFVIRCLTTGEYINVNYEAYQKLYYHTGKIPSSMRKDIVFEDIDCATLYKNEHAKQVLKFKTVEAAQWFANRRLTYNAKRKDWSKLSLMESIFACNDLPDVTVKVEFEVVEIV